MEKGMKLRGIRNFAGNFPGLKSPFTDIHTHQEARSGILSVRNVFLQDAVEKGLSGQGRFSVGLHPWHVDDFFQREATLYSQLEEVAADPRVLAIGEAGLDKAAKTKTTVQQKAFEVQVNVSEKLQKPLIIHCVKAFQEVLAVRKALKAEMPWIFHGFNGSPELAAQILHAGGLLSFGAALLKDHPRTRESLRKAGPDHCFLETDDTSSGIEAVYEKAAAVLNVSVEHLADKVFSHYQKVFKTSE
jgi:TatD DNase family protein